MWLLDNLQRWFGNEYDDYDEDDDIVDRVVYDDNNHDIKIPLIFNKPAVKTSPGVVVLKPNTYDEVLSISDALKDEATIVLNLQGLPVNVAQRIVDYATGACVMVNGHFNSVANSIYIIAPSNTVIDGEMTDAPHK